MIAVLFLLVSGARGDDEHDYLSDSPYYWPNYAPPSKTYVSCLDAALNTTTAIDNVTFACDFGASCWCGLCTKLANSNTSAAAAQYCVMRHANSTADGFECAPLDDAGEQACEKQRVEANVNLALGVVAYLCISMPIVGLLVWCHERRNRYRSIDEQLP